MSDITITGPSFIGRGISTICISPSDEKGVFWYDGKNTHKVADVLGSKSDERISLLTLESDHTRALIPEHFLSALSYRGLNCTFEVAGNVNLPTRLFKYGLKAQQFPAGNAQTFYDRLPKGSGLARYEAVASFEFQPTKEATLRLIPTESSDLSIALSWTNDKLQLRPLPYETNTPLLDASARGINGRPKGILGNVLQYIFAPNITSALYQTPDEIRITKSRNEQLRHTAGSDIPGEILGVLGGRLEGRIEIECTQRGRGANHKGRLDFLRLALKEGAIKPIDDLLKQ